MAHKNIIFNEDARAKLLLGAGKLNEAVAATLGPKGRNVVFGNPYGSPRITKDGVTVAKEVILEDEFENIGAQMIKAVANKTNETAGDGTTTATILAYEIMKGGFKCVAAGSNPMDIKRGISLAVTEIIEQLGKNAKSISTTAEIAQVGTVSANGEKWIGETIAKAMHTVGKDGVISVEVAEGHESGLKTVKGMEFDRGYFSPYFITNQEKRTADLKDPYILFYDGTIDRIDNLMPILELIGKNQASILVIADDYGGEVLGLMCVNKLRNNLKVLAVKAPGHGARRKEILEDMAILTGGTVITDDVGLTLKTATLEQLGRCKTVRATKDTTLFVESGGKKELVKARCDQLKVQASEATSDFERQSCEERIAKLAGGVAVIEVGGLTDIEINERRDRIDDALHATKAAIEEGIVAGGGSALLYAASEIDFNDFDNEDQARGFQIVLDATRAPIQQIALNAGVPGEVVANGVLQENKPNFGYDAQEDKYGDMIKMGIIDPLKVTRMALEDAASVAGLLITTQVVITDAKDDKQNDGPRF